MYRRLGAYLLRNRRDYIIGVAVTIVYAGFFALYPKTVQWAIDALVSGAPARAVLGACAFIGGVALLRSFFRFFSRVRIFNAARNIEFQLRDDLFAHLQRLPQSFYARSRTGDLMSRCVNDLTSVRLMLGVGLLQLAQTPVMVCTALTMMIIMDPGLTLWMVLPLPAFVFIARALGPAMHASNLAVQEGLAEMSNYLQENITGVAVVRAYAMRAVSERRFGTLAQKLYARWMRAVRVQASMPALAGLLPNISMLVLFVVGGGKLLAGELGVGEFFAFFLFNAELTMPLFLIGWMFNLVQRGAASMQRIDEVLAAVPSIADREDVLPVRKLRGEIEFSHLNFRYPGSAEDAARAPALHDITLRVPAGSVLGVVGPVGSGKSTLASLIPRLYELPDGMLRVDGHEINRLPLATLRRAIAMVPQDAFLFSLTLEDNIAFGLPATERAQVQAAAARAQLARDIGELPDGYETLVGERGVKLSGGQRQRTALARALALDPRILILDDTLSAVDAETEAAIQRELARVFEGRTVVMVASRVSAVREADHIVVLEAGRIVERGTHAELMARGGLYTRLARDEEAERALKKLEALAEATGGAA